VENRQEQRVNFDQGRKRPVKEDQENRDYIKRKNSKSKKRKQNDFSGY